MGKLFNDTITGVDEMFHSARDTGLIVQPFGITVRNPDPLLPGPMLEPFQFLLFYSVKLCSFSFWLSSKIFLISSSDNGGCSRIHSWSNALTSACFIMLSDWDSIFQLITG